MLLCCRDHQNPPRVQLGPYQRRSRLSSSDVLADFSGPSITSNPLFSNLSMSNNHHGDSAYSPSSSTSPPQVLKIPQNNARHSFEGGNISRGESWKSGVSDELQLDVPLLVQVPNVGGRFSMQVPIQADGSGVGVGAAHNMTSQHASANHMWHGGHAGVNSTPLEAIREKSETAVSRGGSLTSGSGTARDGLGNDSSSNQATPRSDNDEGQHREGVVGGNENKSKRPRKWRRLSGKHVKCMNAHYMYAVMKVLLSISDVCMVHTMLLLLLLLRLVVLLQMEGMCSVNADHTYKWNCINNMNSSSSSSSYNQMANQLSMLHQNRHRYSVVAVAVASVSL